MSTEPENRRRFSRVEFDAQSVLYTDSGTTPVTLVDISLKGALVRLPAANAALAGQELTLEVQLAGHEQQIRMQCELAHAEGDQAGLKCLHIDLDSASHLRRLVELNLGDPDLLDREFTHLI